MEGQGEKRERDEGSACCPFRRRVAQTHDVPESRAATMLVPSMMVPLKEIPSMAIDQKASDTTGFHELQVSIIVSDVHLQKEVHPHRSGVFGSVSASDAELSSRN